MEAATFPHQLQVKPFHFFKIITAQNLQDGKLMIPNKFVEKYGEGLPNALFLKTPNGTEWNFNLEKHDGKIWFQKGWKEFAEYHSLAHGHLLVFRRHGTSHFQVHIFDLSSLEIDYPSKGTEGKTSPNHEGNKQPRNEENLEYLQPYQVRSHKSVKVENMMTLPEEAQPHTDTKFKEKSKVVVANQVTALDLASSFKPCNPFFLVVMRPSYIQSNGGPLPLQTKFCRRHFGLLNKRHINLQVLNGRIWPAKYMIQKMKNKTNFRLTSGWKTFVKDNNLKVGNVCTFELIDGTKLTLLVHIFRGTNGSNCSTSQDYLMIPDGICSSVEIIGDFLNEFILFL
ncbi:hypothetical protein AAZV13_16G042500 [Glycine max]